MQKIAISIDEIKSVLLAEFPQAVIEAAITNDIIIASFFFIINSSNLFPIGDIAFERILIPDYKVYKKSRKILHIWILRRFFVYTLMRD